MLSISSGYISESGIKNGRQMLLCHNSLYIYSSESFVNLFEWNLAVECILCGVFYWIFLASSLDVGLVCMSPEEPKWWQLFCQTRLQNCSPQSSGWYYGEFTLVLIKGIIEAAVGGGKWFYKAEQKEWSFCNSADMYITLSYKVKCIHISQFD